MFVTASYLALRRDPTPSDSVSTTPQVARPPLAGHSSRPAQSLSSRPRLLRRIYSPGQVAGQARRKRRQNPAGDAPPPDNARWPADRSRLAETSRQASCENQPDWAEARLPVDSGKLP